MDITNDFDERPAVDITVDGNRISASTGSTILEALEGSAIDTPTLCYLETLTPINACRLCVVEVEGSRALVPSCSRKVEAGMVIHTGTERVRNSRRLVLELLLSSVDLSLASDEVRGWIDEYRADGQRFGKPDFYSPESGAVHGHQEPQRNLPATVSQPVKRDNDLYVRDYSKCILCYKCVEACGPDAQNTFAIWISGRGFDARVSTEYDVALTDSACVYCGNCIAVCPTGALVSLTEFDMREEGTWDEEAQHVTRTVCPYCGVGCNVDLHVQDNRVVKVTSPLDHEVTRGSLCIKGRFGFEYVQSRGASTAEETAKE